MAASGPKVGTDFPIVCEVCLGPNPYVRMMKIPMGRECKISRRPFTAFRWRAGAEGRFKETIIAPEVASAKGVCQACLMDMQYNLPVGVRDHLTKAAGGGPSNVSAVAPSTGANKDYYWEQKRRDFEAGDGNLLTDAAGGMGAGNGGESGGRTPAWRSGLGIPSRGGESLPGPRRGAPGARLQRT